MAQGRWRADLLWGGGGTRGENIFYRNRRVYSLRFSLYEWSGKRLIYKGLNLIGQMGFIIWLSPTPLWVLPALSTYCLLVGFVFSVFSKNLTNYSVQVDSCLKSTCCHWSMKNAIVLGIFSQKPLFEIKLKKVMRHPLCHISECINVLNGRVWIIVNEASMLLSTRY